MSQATRRYDQKFFQLYATVKKKMEVMQQTNMSWVEVQFLQKAVDILSQCRRTLMYTYAFAFYLQKDNQSMIFEDNQRDLEHATEQLSEFLERDLENENLVSLKQKVSLHTTRYVNVAREKYFLKVFFLQILRFSLQFAQAAGPFSVIFVSSDAFIHWVVAPVAKSQSVITNFAKVFF